MAISKKELFGDKEIELAKYAKALSHPARLAILKLLSERSCCCCGDIVDSSVLSQSTISQHLKELKEAGLIQGEITPPKIKYCINKKNWEAAKQCFNAFFKEV